MHPKIRLNIAVAGAGVSGSVIARTLAEQGHSVVVFERRTHAAGNCHTERDDETGIMVHRHGPHIFHTDDDEVWAYVNRFATFKPYVHRVKAVARGKVYPMPVNLHTINQFFGRQLSPTEAQSFIAQQATPDIAHPANFEEQALHTIGRELYEAFFRGYTIKQWGVPPHALSAEVLRRLPIRFNYDDNYFSHRYQGIPVEGYTLMVERILDHPNITLRMNANFTRAMAHDYDHLFYTGTIDGFYDFQYGRLPYRTLDFVRQTGTGDMQGCAQMNFCDETIPYTRVTEHKHFAPWENHALSVCHAEYSRDCLAHDIPYYPLSLVQKDAALEQYQAMARRELNITFLGRLGTYRYLDMDISIKEALRAATAWCETAIDPANTPVTASR